MIKEISVHPVYNICEYLEAFHGLLFTLLLQLLIWRWDESLFPRNGPLSTWCREREKLKKEGIAARGLPIVLRPYVFTRAWVGDPIVGDGRNNCGWIYHGVNFGLNRCERLLEKCLTKN